MIENISSMIEQLMIQLYIPGIYQFNNTQVFNEIFDQIVDPYLVHRDSGFRERFKSRLIAIFESEQGFLEVILMNEKKTAETEIEVRKKHSKKKTKQHIKQAVQDEKTAEQFVNQALNEIDLVR